MIDYKIIKQKPLSQNKAISPSQNITTKLSKKECKFLIDNLVDPICIISNANYSLKKKLIKFVNNETRENFYMIERAQQQLINSINQLRSNSNLTF